MQNRYYRMVLDFSHDFSREELDEVLEALAHNIFLQLDPHENGNPECTRAVRITGGDVTMEYAYVDELKVQYFQHELEDASIVEQFMDEDSDS